MVATPDDEHAVHEGTTGGMGGGSDRGGHDRDAARAYIERSGEDPEDVAREGISLHEAETGLDLGADDDSGAEGE
jgi:hypothetical protein